MYHIKFIILLVLQIGNVYKIESLFQKDSCTKATERFKKTVSIYLSSVGNPPNDVYIFNEKKWRSYKEEYQKVYNLDEDHHARKRYRENIEKINEHNRRYMNQNVTYKLASNQFTDQGMKNLKRTFSRTAIPHLNFTQQITIPLCETPNRFDYRDYMRYHLNVLNKTSGSGWSEAVKSATAVLSLLKFQNQVTDLHQAIDDIELNARCDDVEKSYECLEKFKNIIQMENFQNNHERTDPVICLPSGNVYKNNVSTSESDERLRKVVAHISPVIVLFSPISFEFLHYSQGIFSPPETDVTKSYFMVVMGYGTEDGVDYWLLQNSFGHNWGENGYIRLNRTSQVLCPITYLMI